LLLFWVLAISLLVLGRFTLRRIAYSLRRTGKFVNRVLIAGCDAQGLAIGQQLHGPRERGIELVGFLDDYLAVGSEVTTNGRHTPGDPFTIIGHPRDASHVAASLACDVLVVVPGALTWESQQRLAQLQGAKGLDVRVAPTHYEVSTGAVEAAPLGYIPMLRLLPVHLTGVDAIVRTSLDVLVAAVLLTTAAPVLTALVMVARLRGIQPLLTSRAVLGERGRLVTLRVLDPAVTQRLILRGLPALIAVLRGDMALVGPRPLTVEEAALHEPWLGLLTGVKPGLIGPWRLMHGITSPEEMLLADVWWVRNWTVWQHLFVLFQVAIRIVAGSQPHQGLVRWEASRTGASNAVAVGVAVPNRRTFKVALGVSRSGFGQGDG
jgi:lipopolysaccharide/colanic/teichoic acid biosynthesis glycosyltransferase